MAGNHGEQFRAFFRASLRVDSRLRLELEQARAYGKSHSVFTGRVVGPGEPEFLPEDTDGAIALAEEERDTCPSCGMQKAWCRDPVNQFGVFEPHQEFCWASYRLADFRKAKFDKLSESQQASWQVWAGFREGHEPAIEAGLDLGADQGGPGQESSQEG